MNWYIIKMVSLQGWVFSLVSFQVWLSNPRGFRGWLSLWPIRRRSFGFFLLRLNLLKHSYRLILWGLSVVAAAAAVNSYLNSVCSLSPCVCGLCVLFFFVCSFLFLFLFLEFGEYFGFLGFERKKERKSHFKMWIIYRNNFILKLI